MLALFDPPPSPDELPDRLASPFAHDPPHPLARRAAAALVRDLPPLAEGKMFGVLVVAAPDGRIGYLRAFSGMLDGTWHVPGFVPPAFDVAARDAFWPAAEAELATLPPHERRVRSRVLLRLLHDTYAFANARGETRSLRELFAPVEPPGGAGDCAAPKLLAYAYRERLRPLALAELWWGPPPRSGGRHAGNFYPACRGK